ncbi:sensor domain-containing protein [Martelella soudanensis]|uniref:sensor domain-containing protein n=1 Tax=unclassified Martelella TaxID=2629616 RepID=UPI0015DDA878|nr:MULTISPECIES: bifunctional diguanylate cyclase/phosphodiesterase [unclassified Martelella]
MAVLDVGSFAIRAVNESFQALAPESDLLGGIVFDWVHSDDRPCLQSLLSPAARTGKPLAREVRFGPRPDGPWRWMLCSSNLLPPEHEGSETLSLLNCVDIDAQKLRELEANERAHRWDYALVSSGLGVWDHDYRRGQFFYSQTWMTMRGYPAGGPRPFTSTEEWLQLVHPDDRDFVANAIERQKAGDSQYMNFEYRERHADGHWIWIECRGDAVSNFSDHSPARVVGTDRDITDRKNAEMLLSRTRQRLELALSTSRIGVFEYNPATGMVIADRRIGEIYGFEEKPETFDVSRLGAITDPDDRNRIRTTLQSLKPGDPPHSDEFKITREDDGTVRHIRALMTMRIDDEGQRNILGINWDVTEEVRLRQDLITAKQLAEARNFELDRAKSDIEQAVMHDYLTGLPNRRFLDDELSRRVEMMPASSSKLALMQIDIDDFKAVNDSYGHGTGDAVLQHTAQVLLSVSRHNDFVARVGGDEFAFISSYGNGSGSLEQVAKRMLLELSKPIELGEHRIRIGACVGIVTADACEDVSTGALMKNSDLALKRAKQQGRNRIAFYTPDLNNAVAANRTPADQLMQAVEQSDFIPFYQPQFDAKTLRLTGVETLARWRHADGSFGQPSEFIPLAETLNLMNMIDTSILSQATSDYRRWSELGLDPPGMSLNLSPRRLSDPALVSALEEFDLPAGKLTFELLESIFLDEPDDISAYNLKQLRRLGIGIDVDDFGTGYTSITGLLKVAPNGLKIARELILPLPQSPDQRAIVKSIVDIAKTLKIKVIAEGVETKRHAEIVTKLGCDVLQGYWLGRPMPASEFEKVLRRQTEPA